MKLRNKKTGYVGNWCIDKDVIRTCDGSIVYNSLAELNKDWEDYEEPVGWCVTMYGGISRITKDDEILIPDLKEIGNYFNDKESAYDALDKLKAWKRLKDKGFRFCGWKNGKLEYPDYVVFDCKDYKGNANDLDIIFGGEE